MKKYKYQFKFDLKIKSPFYIGANSIEKAENKINDKATIIIDNINRRKVGTLKWDFK